MDEELYTGLPLANRDFRVELGQALVTDPAFAKDMAVAAAKALSGDLLEADRSHDETRQLVTQALRDEYRRNDNDYGPWIREIFDDHVVFEHQGDTWQVDYSIDDEDEVTLGEERVKVTVRYVPTSEAAEGEDGIPIEGPFVRLLEKALRSDDTIAVKVIEPGKGSSGRYDPEVLERDGAEAFPVGTKMYWDHPTLSEETERPERSLRDLAAELVAAPTYQESGSDGPGLYADAKVFGPYKEVLEDLAPHIGISIRALGVVNEDGGEPVVEKIAPSPHNTIDFVTEPGAGGKVLALFESARGRGTPPAPRKEEEQMSERDLKEAQQRATDAETKLQEAQQKLDEATQERDRLREAAVIREAKEVAYRAFDKIKEEAKFDLPQMTRDRLAERLSKNPPTTDEGALDETAFEKQVAEAVKDEADYLAKVTGSGRITGLGSSDPGDGDPQQAEEALAESLKALGLSEDAAKAGASGR